MNDRDEERLQRVISRYLDDEANEEETAWLVARIGESSEELEIFSERLLMESELVHLSDDDELKITTGRRLRGLLRKPVFVSVAAAAAVLAVAALVLSVITVPKPPPFANWSASPGSVVSVSNAEGAEGELLKGATIQVSQGCAEVLLEEGVRCLIQAPAMLTLVDKGEAKLEGGVARFRVDPSAKGYVVRTAAIAVTDLGTEFGIDARGEFRAEVHVMEGKVEARSLRGSKKANVAAGSAVALGAIGRLEPVPIDEARFLKDLPKGLPALRFSFDQIEGGVIRGEGSIAKRDGVRIQMQGPNAPKSIPGRFQKGLSFFDVQYAASNWKGIEGTRPRSISFWVKFNERIKKWPYPLMGWGVFRDSSKMGDFGIRMTELTGQLRIVSGKRWLESERTLIDGSWHHVAIVVGSYQQGSWPETKLFIDGVEDPLMPGEPMDAPMAPLDSFYTKVDHIWSQPLTLGRFGVDDPVMLPGLRGALDELIIAEGVLTREQVIALFEGRLSESGLDLGD